MERRSLFDSGLKYGFFSAVHITRNFRSCDKNIGRKQIKRNTKQK